MLELYIGRIKAGSAFYYRGRAYQDGRLVHDVGGTGWADIVRIMRKVTRGAPIRPVWQEPAIDGIMHLSKHGYEPLSARHYRFLERKIDKLSKKQYGPRRGDDELRQMYENP